MAGRAVMETGKDILAKVLGSSDLPTVPGLALRIIRMAQDPEVRVEEMAELIGHDPALAAKLLRTVNSAFYGLRRQVSTLSRAVTVLGTRGVSALAVGFSVAGILRTTTASSACDLAPVWELNVHSAVTARLLAERTRYPAPEEAFVAALLQDIGVLGLHRTLGAPYDCVYESVMDHEALERLERAALGTSHPEVGGAMAWHWSLPDVLVSAIACHHCPEAAPEAARPLVRIVHTARLIAGIVLASDARSVTLTAYESVRGCLGLDAKDLEQILRDVVDSTSELVSLFDVRPIPRDELESALASACDALTEFALSGDSA